MWAAQCSTASQWTGSPASRTLKTVLYQGASGRKPLTTSPADAPQFPRRAHPSQTQGFWLWQGGARSVAVSTRRRNGGGAETDPAKPRGLQSGEDRLQQEWSQCSMRTCWDLGTWEGVAAGLRGSRREALREGSDAGGFGPLLPATITAELFMSGGMCGCCAAGRGVVLAPTQDGRVTCGWGGGWPWRARLCGQKSLVLETTK